MLNQIIGDLFPKKADNNLQVGALPVIIFLILTIVGFLRSLIHIFSPDGGAGSIAGMNLDVSGAQGIVFAFGLWGSSQLLMSLFQFLVFFRYRSLIPFMYLIIILEILLRMLIGAIKPVDFAGKPPGVIGNWVVLPLAVLMLGLCLSRTQKRY